MDHTKSAAVFAQAQTLIPGGVNSPARAFGSVGGTPVVIDRAEGPWLFDVDGNRYLDYVLSWGPMILGHANERVSAALCRAVSRGTSYGAPTVMENKIAEQVRKMIPSIEKIRLVSSGTEATMSAIRLARGFTGRDKIIKFTGCYHGHSDALLVSAGSSAATLGVPNSPGVTAGAVADTIPVPYNDFQAVSEVFQAYGDRMAGVIVEPVVGNMGCVVPKPGFLELLRQKCDASGALLIFDEVMTGFRVARGGAQEYFGIRPDLTTLGKIIGGGLPVGAYGGRADVMDAVLPAGKVFQAGTLSGNPLATAAGYETLRVIDQTADFYPRVASAMSRLGAGLEEAAAAAGIHARFTGIGAMGTLFFPPAGREAPSCWAEASACDTRLFARYFHAMLDRGIYLPCSQFEALFTSIEHTDEFVDMTVAAAREVFRSLKD